MERKEYWQKGKKKARRLKVLLNRRIMDRMFECVDSELIT
jgi:hypothetical protein